jgi:fusion and transport protein UGO1
MINRDASPVTFSIANFFSSSVALLVKLPLETILRRGQAAVLASPAYVAALDMPFTQEKGKGRNKHNLSVETTSSALETVVPLGSYNGVFGTMYTIVGEEGSRHIPTQPASTAKTRAATKKGKTRVAETVFRRGQGLPGLWRGWKVSWWGLVGLWAAGVAGGGGNGEF